MPRWLAVLVVAAVIALGAREARAQVFRPRTGKAVVNKAAPAQSAATTGKKGPTADASTSKGPRAAAANPKRTGPAKKRKAKSRDSDDVKIDDEEEDVKITDD